MTELEFQFRTELLFSEPVWDHVFSLHCLPREDAAQQTQSYGITLEPAAGYELRRDGFGSWLVCGSCLPPHRRFVYGSHGIVRVDHTRKEQGGNDPVFRYPTPLTLPDNAIRALWQTLPLAGKPPREQAELLNRAAAEALAYCTGTTGVGTSAAEALKAGKGVCQDHTHLLLSLARLSGFAARYCMGLIPGEGATHAWAELALPEGWQGFDPTNRREADETYLRFAVGRDAADCLAEKGVFRGDPVQNMNIQMKLWKRERESVKG